ncbi:MAG TPA: fumarylacetoacetate hydrolase family protein [Chloroflexota bacterium]|jgi:2-dehydro-3-deoxy-D-arabinonate dehydratase|nr:fumarylacetoacetate hydrolase family protein [Chloroflexota bacterium]
MRIIQFDEPGEGTRVGVTRGDDVYDVTGPAGAGSLALLLAARDGRAPDLSAAPRVASYAELDVPPEAGRRHLRLPVDPAEVWGAGVTYKKSAEFRDEDTSTSKGIYDMVYSAPRPELFYKGRAVHCAGPNGAGTIRSDSAFTAPEPELALVLSAGGDILGYTLCDDVSAWDIERENPLYLPQSKIFYGCAVIGPAVVTPDEIPDPRALTLRCAIRRGGETVFDESVGLDRLKRSFEELIGYLRRNNPIPDGTVLSTGTGIIVPQELALREGDELELECQPIGTLRHTMRRLPERWELV